MRGEAAARRASAASKSASAWNMMIIGALALLMLVLVAERSMLGARWGSGVRERRAEDPRERAEGPREEDERAGTAAGRAEAGEARRAEGPRERAEGSHEEDERAGTAEGRRDGTGRATKVRMVHVGKTGGQSAKDFLRGLPDFESIHANYVRRWKVREEEPPHGARRAPG